jgi:uncharacterized protein YndB with AHSA1/START domain
MEHVQVTRTIPAPPERVYALVSDLPRMGEWSPENRGGKWLKGASGPTVGARFRGTNRKGWISWRTLVTVAVAEPGEEFAFDVTTAGLRIARWGYRLVPAAGGTQVTEYWDDHRKPFVAKLTGFIVRVPDRAEHNRAGMEQTLDRLGEAAAESPTT